MISNALEVIKEEDFGVVVEMKYATDDNLMRRPVYSKPVCALHKDAAGHLRRAVQLAKGRGYSLRIYDAYRPPEVQWVFWDANPNPDYFADPRRGSPHSRGVAVDLTLCTPDGVPLDMGTAFDAFDVKSHHGNTDISEQAQKNRQALRQIMLDAGWDDYKNEWWHYQLFNAREKYPLISNEESGLDMVSMQDVVSAADARRRWTQPA